QVYESSGQQLGQDLLAVAAANLRHARGASSRPRSFAENRTGFVLEADASHSSEWSWQRNAIAASAMARRLAGHDRDCHLWIARQRDRGSDRALVAGCRP